MPEDAGGTKTNHVSRISHDGQLKQEDAVTVCIQGHTSSAISDPRDVGVPANGHHPRNTSQSGTQDSKPVSASVIQSIPGLTLDPSAGGAPMALMNLAQVQNAGLLQAAGLAGLGDSGAQGTIPFMIQTQGVGGGAPLAFIYPFAANMVPSTTATATTNTASTSANILVQPVSGINSSNVITVAPQSDNETSSSPALSSVMGGDFTTQPGSSKEMTLDLKQLTAAMTGSLHNAINHQIVMEIKNETVSPMSQEQLPAATMTVTTIPPEMTDTASSPPPSTPEDESGSGYFSKSKRPKMGGSGGKEDKLCRVCGDRALGCNFDAISCESCKAFFRRNALKEKQPKCLFDGSCKIDLNTRRFCPFCRLQKCLAIGMKKELILREDEKRKRQIKVKTNREKRIGKGGCQSPTFPSPLTPGTVNPSTPSTVGDDDSEVYLESHADQIQESQDYRIQEPMLKAPSPSQSPKLEMLAGVSGIVGMGLTLGGMSFSMAGSSTSQVNSIPSTATTAPEITNLLSLSKFAQKSELSSSMQLDTFLVRRLTSEENRMLQELMQVYDLSFTVDLEPLIHIKHLDPSLNQLINQSSITVLRLIKFAKRLEEFVRLSQECQIGILKCTWIHILLLRSVSLYDSERDVWVTPKGDIPTEIMKNATGFVKLHDDHISYCKGIKMIIRDDLMIVVILLVIVLFSPEGPNVINRELVSNIQDKYLVLLKHYLESKYTYVRAAEMYPMLMAKIRELKELAEIHGKYLLDLNPSEIEPIMLEILDLK